MDTDFAEKTTKRFFDQFIALMDSEIPQGNKAYLDLYAGWSGEMRRVYGNDAGSAVSACQTTISRVIEMTVLAYPNLIIPK